MWLQPKKKPLAGMFEKLGQLLAKTAELEMQRKAIRAINMLNSLGDHTKEDAENRVRVISGKLRVTK